MKTSNKVERKVDELLNRLVLKGNGLPTDSAARVLIPSLDAQEAKQAILSLIEAEKALVLEEVLGKLPKVSKFNSRGGLRPFSTKDVWDYGDVYTKAEANYKAKVTQIIKGVKE